MSFILIWSGFVARADSCVSLNPSRTDFLPGETMQLEVNIDLSYASRELYVSDLFLYKIPENTPVGANFFLTKISDTKYFVWFDVPNIIGNYVLKVRETCNGNIVLSQTGFSIEEPKDIYYDNLESKVSGKWSTLSLEENIMAAGALSYNNALEQDAMTAYFSRKDSCVNVNCSSKDAALSMIAFKDFATRAQMKSSARCLSK